MNISESATAAATDGDGFFIHRTDEGESYVGIGDECGDFMLAAMTADRMRAVAALLLAEAAHLEARSASVLVRICIDEDCPSCGWPERYADLPKQPNAAVVFGCNKCDHRGLTRTT